MPVDGNKSVEALGIGQRDLVDHLLNVARTHLGLGYLQILYYHVDPHNSLLNIGRLLVE